MTEFHSAISLRVCAVAVFALLVVSVSQVAACPKDKPFRRLSRPEKMWTAVHPFKARKVYECATRARAVTDSLENAGVLSDPNGGRLDAFRHAYWMGLLVAEGMKEDVVRKIGERHEKGNYIDFRQEKREENERSDSMMSVMDLRNNEAGINIGTAYRRGDKKLSLIASVIYEIQSGNLFIMHKNANGEYLDKNEQVIRIADYAGKWYIPKVLVKSDTTVVPH